ncbi:hypothetical protein TI39_contig1051g00024 [Zymoseptoria brevis]|uniref:Uncharacterized protein n=1 Tax=Zymoseptoria brevis TaxID=1047168 RepID=A0A0F4GEK0_9PEZI|nr:hypothetical protein TI39_contig1051g00024 [Zymoseptoria brevis]
MTELTIPLPSTTHPAFTHLILLCGHATYLGPTTPSSASLDEQNWSLQSFQRSNPTTHKPGEHHTFLSHIHTAASLAASTPSSLLIFSGRQTTPTEPSNPEALTEAQSYARLLRMHLSALQRSSSSEEKVNYACDNSATDSYQNLLFSILRFRQLTHSYPAQVTVVTHAFKAPRFLHLHGPAIKFPAHQLRVLGINPPFTAQEFEETEVAESERGYAPWKVDLYGVGAVLGRKRMERGWDDERAKDGWMSELRGEVRELLEWQGGSTGREIFPKTLPWEAENVE